MHGNKPKSEHATQTLSNESVHPSKLCHSATHKEMKKQQQWPIVIVVVESTNVNGSIVMH